MDIDNAPTSAAGEHPLQFPINIASLENLAATSLTLDLWHHNRLGHFSMPPAVYTDPNFSCGQVLRVLLPRQIMKTINTRIRSVGLEVNSLYLNFSRIGMFGDLCTFVKYFDDLAYGPDGEMCPERTAKNFLTRSDLTQWMKFQIACVYWFEDEIRQIWPTVIDYPDTKKTYFSEARLFVRYWMAIMQNCSTDSVPNVSYFEFDHMFHVAKDFGNWTTVANLLNKLTADQQYDCIKSLVIQEGSGFKNVLPKLEKMQVAHILAKSPRRIISGLALQKGGFEYAIKMWNLVREYITMEAFYEIIRFLRRHAYDADEYKHTLPIRTQAQAVLLEMWITAPEKLKIEFFNQYEKVERLFEYLSEIEVLCYHRLDNDINFISRLFSDLPVEMRSRIWHKYWSHIAFFSPAKMFHCLLSLGVTNDEYNKFVEEEMMNFTKAGVFISYWLEARRYEEVINYTKLCSWNEQLVRKFRERIFSHIIPSEDRFGFDELVKIGAVIDESLPNVEAKDCKKMILYSYKGRRIFSFELIKGLAIESISKIDRFLRTERSVRELQLFLDHWRNFLTFDEYYTNLPDVATRWNEFLSWWVDKEDDLPIFKEFLPVDQVFQVLWLKAVPMLEIRFGALGKEIPEHVPSPIDKLEEFAEVDEFLMWYFGNEEAAKNFKRNKISNYQNIVELNDLLSISNESIVNRVIAWFFNYNLIEVEQFKNEFEKKDLLS